MLIQKELPNVEENMVINEKIDWSKRPLNTKSKYTVLRETSYLIDLYHAFYEQIFEKYSKGCDLYLNIVKNCENEEILDQFYKVNLIL